MVKCHNLIQDKNSTEYMSLMFRETFFKINKFKVDLIKLKDPMYHLPLILKKTIV